MKLVRQFGTDRRGNIATLAAVTLPLLIGGAAFGTEVSYWMAQKSKLRGATDGAAITAANMYLRKADQETINTVVSQALVKSGISQSTLYVNVTLPAGGEPLKVVTRVPGEKYFTRALWKGSVAIDARTDISFDTGNVCILATNKSAADAMAMTGNASGDLNGCLAASNSSSTSAISFGGSSDLTAGCLYTAGDVSGLSKVTMTKCARPMNFRREITPPLAGRTQPVRLGGCSGAPKFKPNATINVSPGCYNEDFDMKGTVNFAPGVYFFENANFGANGQALITGTGVTFIFKGSSTIKFNGGAVLQLAAPDTASGSPYAGILFWGASTGGPRQHLINGNSGSFLQGLINFDDDEVELKGNAKVNSDCLRLVGDKVKLTGSASFKSDCDAALGPLSMTAPASLRIVR